MLKVPPADLSALWGKPAAFMNQSLPLQSARPHNFVKYLLSRIDGQCWTEYTTDLIKTDTTKLFLLLFYVFLSQRPGFASCDVKRVSFLMCACVSI